MVLTLLKRLQEPDIHTYTIGKVNECLNGMVIGLSHNTIAEAGDIFPFVYMLVSPFVSGGKPIESNENRKEYNYNEIGESPK